MNNFEKPQVIKTPFPDEFYNRVKLSVELDDESKITEQQIKQIYVETIAAFLDGELSIDGISAICNRLFGLVVKLDSTDKNIFPATLAGAELSFYVRKVNLLPQFNSFLKEVLDFYYKFKDEV